MSDTDVVTGEQLRAGRAMLRWEQKELAQRACVPVPTLNRSEGIGGPARGTYENIIRVKRALEDGGVEFTADGGVRPVPRDIERR